MLKKMMTVLLLMTLWMTAAQATILSATGVDEDFAAWTGISCTPAVVLCENLSVMDERGDQGGRKVDTLHYSGETIPVIESWDGYAKIYYADGTKTGWVRNEYLLFDPQWYLCDEGMPVYAYPDTSAPRVGYLATGTKLPIITEYDDGRKYGGWVCVSLRGAAGWIRKTAKDTEVQTWFSPDMLQNITRALLTYQDKNIYISSFSAAVEVAALSELLTNTNDLGAAVSGCPFTATLTLWLADGRTVDIQLATDSCCVYRVDNRDYQYARHLMTAEGSPDNMVLYSLFGMTLKDLYPWME